MRKGWIALCGVTMVAGLCAQLPATRSDLRDGSADVNGSTRTHRPLSSAPVERRGLSMVVTLAKGVFREDEEIAFSVALGNVSEHPIELADLGWWDCGLRTADGGDSEGFWWALAADDRRLGELGLRAGETSSLPVSVRPADFRYVREDDRGAKVPASPAPRRRGKHLLWFHLYRPPADVEAGPSSLDDPSWVGDITSDPVAIEIVASETAAD